MRRLEVVAAILARRIGGLLSRGEGGVRLGFGREGRGDNPPPFLNCRFYLVDL